MQLLWDFKEMLANGDSQHANECLYINIELSMILQWLSMLSHAKNECLYINRGLCTIMKWLSMFDHAKISVHI